MIAFEGLLVSFFLLSFVNAETSCQFQDPMLRLENTFANSIVREKLDGVEATLDLWTHLLDQGVMSLDRAELQRRLPFILASHKSAQWDYKSASEKVMQWRDELLLEPSFGISDPMVLLLKGISLSSTKHSH